MIGLLYKELKLNRLSILGLFAGSIIFLALLVLTTLLSDNKTDDSSSIIVMIGFVYSTIFFMINGALESSIMESGEKKKWAYFIKSTPETEKGEVGAKYIFVLMCTLGMYFWICLLNSILSDIFDTPFFASPVIYVAMIQLFVKSLQFPMTMRFGGKMGSYIRIAVILVTMVIFGLFALYYKGFTLDGLYDKLMVFYDELAGNAENQTVTESHLKVYNAVNIFSCVTLVMYFISYKISCRMYLKGVESNYAR